MVRRNREEEGRERGGSMRWDIMYIGWEGYQGDRVTCLLEYIICSRERRERKNRGAGETQEMKQKHSKLMYDLAKADHWIATRMNENLE